MQDHIWTIGSVLEWTRQFFKDAGIESFKLDAELLLAHVCNCSRLQLFLNYDKPLIAKELTQYRLLIKRRKTGEPVAYLIHQKNFWSLEEPLIINHGVLVPRPETEILVEMAVQRIQQLQKSDPTKRIQILELGTGSLALPLALIESLKNLDIISIDISHDALQVANSNRLKFHSSIDKGNHQLMLIHTDRFDCISQQASFDFIISNPPYIPSNQISTLQIEVQQEPYIALDGGADGLNFYKYLIKVAPSLLKAKGELLVEIGIDQSEQIEKLLSDSLFLKEVSNDLQEIPRAMCFVYLEQESIGKGMKESL